MRQIYLVFGLGLLLVYLCLAGQYESWIAPLSVILAVPLALSGPALALGALGLANNGPKSCCTRRSAWCC